jgi:alkaline phosphatase D
VRDQRIDNLVVLTGDIHSSWGSDLTPNPFDGSYNPATGGGALGVEFVAPGVTSPFLFPDTPEGAAQAAGAALQIRAISPHMKLVELFRRGYLLLDINRSRVQGEWYYPRTIRERDLAHNFGGAMASASGIANLQPAAGPAPARTDAPDPAP